MIIQFRGDKKTAKDEFDGCKKAMKDRSVFCDVFDAFAQAPTDALIKKYDAFILGGCGEYFVSKNDYPFQKEMIAFIKKAKKAKVPVLGICYGFHLIGKAFGGKVIHVPEKKEVGTFLLSLNKQGQKSCLFAHVPNTFFVQEGHKDHLCVLPKKAVALASTKSCEIQAFEMPQIRMYGVQFHPEMSKKNVQDRIKASYKSYLSEDQKEEALSMIQETPLAKKVIQNFIRLI